jgi:hypothetical protein
MPSVLGAFSLSTADAWAPRVSPVFSTTLVDPGRESSVTPAPHLGCRQAFTDPSSFPPLNPPSNRALTSLNGFNGYSSPSLLWPATPPGALSRPYKSHPDDPRDTPHLTEPLSSPLSRRNPSPPSFPWLLCTTASPGRHAAA